MVPETAAGRYEDCGRVYPGGGKRKCNNMRRRESRCGQSEVSQQRIYKSVVSTAEGEEREENKKR